ncbi:MAG: hypothetical protein A2Y38_13995 [Spirochaetes bacterium GWB1_59_5]|nr:MAG: hypothetical protein A2Y38_13995 [Spirochaetes bacterium GWB1_59_5]
MSKMERYRLMIFGAQAVSGAMIAKAYHLAGIELPFHVAILFVLIVQWMIGQWALANYWKR